MDAVNTSRWTRKHARKIGTLLPRDIAVLRWLRRYRYARADFLHKLVGGNYRAFTNRLRLMKDEPNCLIRTPHEQQIYIRQYAPQIFELDENGEQALKDLGQFDEHGAATWLKRTRDEERIDFEHAVMICDALQDIELAATAAGLTFVPWPELFAQMPEETRNRKYPHRVPLLIRHAGQQLDKALESDAIFALKYPDGKYCIYVLEADRGTEPLRRFGKDALEKTSYLRKVLQYRELISGGKYQDHFGIYKSGMMVLNVAPNPSRADGILELVTEITGKNSYMLVATMPTLGMEGRPKPDGKLLTAPWKRAGYPPFNIAERR